jgi:molybdopterin biosynthesis enzyme
VRVEGEELAAEPVEFHGSGDMAGLGRCDCLIAVPIGKGEIKAGKMVKVYLFES